MIALATLFAVIVAFNLSPLSTRLGESIARTLTQQTGWRVEVKGAGLTGLASLRLTDVTLTESRGGEVVARLPRVEVAFHPIRYLMGSRDQSVIQRAVLVRPTVNLPDAPWSSLSGPAPIHMASGSAGRSEGAEGDASRPPSGHTVSVSIVDGTLIEGVPLDGAALHGAALDGASLEGVARVWRVNSDLRLDVAQARLDSVERIEVRSDDGAAHLVARPIGPAGAKRWEWEADLPATWIAELLPYDALRAQGAVSARGVFTLNAMDAGEGEPWRVERVELLASDGSVAWGADAESQVHFDTLRFAAEAAPYGWDVREMSLGKGIGEVTGRGRIEWEEGGLGQARLQIDVDAYGLSLPEDLPILSAYGMSGATEFHGTLSGTLGAPVLAGKVRIADGRVWGRPITQGEGEITIARGYVGFEQTTLERAAARYSLMGEVRTDVVPTELSIELKAERGSAQELLSVFSLEPVVKGEVDGVVDVEGPVGALRVAGSLSGRDLVVLDRAKLDRATGGFVWTNGELRIGELEIGLGEGVATASGGYHAGALDLNVAFSKWPIDARTRALLDIPSQVNGDISYMGHVSGTLHHPVVSGALTGGSLQLGRLRLLDPQGSVTATREMLTLSNVRLQSVGDGAYRLSGRVDGWLNAPRLDVKVDVQEASLSAILAENGLEWPARLIDGIVSGSITMKGDPRRPSAQFELALSDEVDPQRPLTLRFQLDEGRVQLGNLPLLLGQDGVKIGDISSWIGG